jgi:hypothetical protein
MSERNKNYAQARRDEEVRARTDLQSIVPQQYIDGVQENIPSDTIATKIMKAAIAYIQAMLASNAAPANNAAGPAPLAGNTQIGSPQGSPQACYHRFHSWLDTG